MRAVTPLHRAGGGVHRSRTSDTGKSTGRLSALPPIGARFALHASAHAELARGLRELNASQLTAEALQAAHAAWLGGSVSATIVDGIAVIPVRGVLMKDWNWFSYWFGGSTYESIAHDLVVALEHPDVHAIALAVDSPGGQVDGMTELALRLRAAHNVKPVRAHVDGLGASAAYGIASAAGEVHVAPTALLGSIGTVVTMVDTSKLEEELGIEVIEIVSSQSPKKRPDPSTDSGRSQIQATVDALADVFINLVAENRGVERDVVLNDFGQGDVFVGQSAIDAGLADAITTFDALLSDMAQLTQEPPVFELPTVIAARAPVRAVSAARSAAPASTAGAHLTPEALMATTRAAPRPAATAAPATDGNADKDDTEERPADAGGGTSKKDKDMEDMDMEDMDMEDMEDMEATEDTADAVASRFPAAAAALRTAAAKAERERIAGIRALGRAGLDALIQACIDEPACTREAAALRIVEHDQERRAVHMRNTAADARSFEAPSNQDAGDAIRDDGDDAKVVARISATYAAHRNPTRGRAITQGRS